MHFRRELDFDELIETIDQLADEEIDEVVDWQLTDSPAAKTEKGPSRTLTATVGGGGGSGGTLGPVPGAPWLRDRDMMRRRIEGALFPDVPERTLGYTSGGGGAYTIEALTEMRNAAWRDGNRDAALGLERRIQDMDRPRRRTELPQLEGTIALAPEIGSLNYASPVQNGEQFMPMRFNFRQVHYRAQTNRNDVRDILHVRLGISEDGGSNWLYQQSAVTLEALTALRAPVPLLRAVIDTERAIVIELDPRRSERIEVYLEGP